MTEYYLISPDPAAGPYVLTCPAGLAEALTSGHTMLPHEDAYMGAIHAHAEAQKEAQREAKRYTSLSKEEQDAEFVRWQQNHGTLNEDVYLSETDYSSPEYLGTPVYETFKKGLKKPTPAPKVWTRPEIDAMLRRNPKAVERGILSLFRRQTADEAAAQTTKYTNGIGFSAWAAKKGTYYANWIRGGRSLSGWHLENARKIALKHSRQLVEEANK
jgi:hypothetical protein